jgi:hypothetical protein
VSSLHAFGSIWREARVSLCVAVGVAATTAWLSVESRREAATAAEAAEAAAEAAAAQDKSYPRDYMVRGRIRIELKNEDGTPANANITTSARPTSSHRGKNTPWRAAMLRGMRAERSDVVRGGHLVQWGVRFLWLYRSFRQPLARRSMLGAVGAVGSSVAGAGLFAVVLSLGESARFDPASDAHLEQHLTLSSVLASGGGEQKPDRVSYGRSDGWWGGSGEERIAGAADRAG